MLLFLKLHKLEGLLVFISGDGKDEIWIDNDKKQLYHVCLSTGEYENLLKAASFKY